jgi:hypothetical protein
MSCCYALTKEKKPCRNYSPVKEVNEDIIFYETTCQHHMNFFDSWKHRLPRYAFRVEWNPIYYNHIKRVLENNLVEIGEEDIKKLNPNFHVHFLVLCVKYCKIKYEWNEDLFDTALTAVHWQRRAYGPIYVSVEDLLNLLSCISDPFLAFEKALTTYDANKSQEPIEDDWTLFLKVILHTKWAELILPSSVLDEPTFLEPILLKCKKNSCKNLIKVLENNFRTILTECRKDLYTVVKKDMEVVKEELMAMTWHPDRVFKWCLNTEEKEWLDSDWL